MEPNDVVLYYALSEGHTDKLQFITIDKSYAKDGMLENEIKKMLPKENVRFSHSYNYCSYKGNYVFPVDVHFTIDVGYCIGQNYIGE